MKTTAIRILAALPALAAIAPLTGCSSFRYTSKTENRAEEKLRIESALLVPADNATDDENAGRAITELVGTALFERGVPLYQTESLRKRVANPKAAGDAGTYADLVKETGASHIVFATVHEYRYKTDLDGDPAVGVTIRVVDAKTGRTVWQGSSGNVGYVFASLSSSSQHAIRLLVAKIPLAKREEPKPEKKPEPAPEAAGPARRKTPLSDAYQSSGGNF